MRAVALALTLATLGAGNLMGQGARDSVSSVGTIDGIVSDTTLVPLAGASVTILSTNIHVETGASGRFRIVRLPVGQYILIIRHVGHRPASGMIDVAPNDTTRLSYTLEPTVQSLAATVVTEQRLSPTLAEFEQRRRLGEGQFLTQSDIDTRNAVLTADLFRALRGVAVIPTRRGGMSSYTIASTRMGGCACEIFVDGVRLPSGTNADQLPSPRDIAGIEVYTGPATVPPQFAGGKALCGVVLIWTRVGS